MHYKSFAKKVVPVLVEHGIGVLGMKSLAFGNILKSNTVTPIECLHYAMNLPTSVVINGCDSLERLEQGLQAARTFRPLTQAELDSIHARTAAAGREGQFEPFKTTTMFDGTCAQPRLAGITRTLDQHLEDSSCPKSPPYSATWAASLLTNGLDHGERSGAGGEVRFGRHDFEGRHQMLSAAMDDGQMDLDQYLDRTIFYRPRTFRKQEVREFIYAQSQPLPGSLAVIARVAKAGKVFLATLNNESRELNLHRIETFGLRQYFSVFFSSCYLGVSKPHRGHLPARPRPLPAAARRVRVH